MRIGSLFSGIGGLELGLERAGVGNAVWQVERDPFCRGILAKHWPDAQRFDDVRTVGAHNLSPVDVICGGFPCQDISYAGKGAGLAGERSGLWYEFARIVGEMGPRFVVVENVAALLIRGFGDVLGTLAALGYDAEWRIVRASDVGAAHQRERVFIVANSVRKGIGHIGGILAKNSGETKTRRSGQTGASKCSDIGHETRRKAGEAPSAIEVLGSERSECPSGETKPARGRGTHGLLDRVDRWPARPGETQHDWEPPRTIDVAANRAARLKALGNAVVPQVAEVIGRRVLELNALYNCPPSIPHVTDVSSNVSR